MIISKLKHYGFSLRKNIYKKVKQLLFLIFMRYMVCLEHESSISFIINFIDLRYTSTKIQHFTKARFLYDVNLKFPNREYLSV